jgi:TonB family C-terminal domain
VEAKKTPQADLASKQGLFFSIGLVISLSVVASAFEWRSYDQQIEISQGKNVNSFEELIEIPSTVQPPPPAPPVQQPQIVEVPDDAEVQEDLNIEFDVEAPVLDLPSPALMPAEEETDEIFTIVEEGAAPIGGMPAFYQYLRDNMKYPAVARRVGVEGKVMLSFVVSKDGSISDVTVLKGIGAGCDEEAVRVMASAPHWKPGKQRGKAVNQRCVLPIKFSF